MQHTKDLMRLLRRFAELLEDEAGKNPEFAAKLGAILAPAAKHPVKRARKTPSLPENVPDVYAEFQRLGEEEFVFWLRGYDVATLKAIIRQNGFDAAGHSRRWTDQDKFFPLITDQVKARLKRGSGFMTPRLSVDGGGVDPLASGDSR